MIVDAAVHPPFADSELGPRLGPPWNVRLPPLLGRRAETPFPLLERPADESGAPAFVLERLTARKTSAAILSPLTRGLLPHRLNYAAIARVTNEWLHDQWLQLPDAPVGLYGSIRVPVTVPDVSVTEVERWAGDARFVQIAVPLRTPSPYGDERYFPIWQAAAANDLPVFVRDDGPRANMEPPPTPVGAPIHFAEYHAIAPLATIVHITSLITSGVFDRLPNLKFVFGDGGVDLARSMLWRVDKDWRSGRLEIPWVTELPSSYLRRHIRFISHVEDCRPDGSVLDPEQVRVTEAADLVLFGSNLPFWDQVDPLEQFRDWPDGTSDRILAGNALEVYPRLAKALDASTAGVA